MLICNKILWSSCLTMSFHIYKWPHMVPKTLLVDHHVPDIFSIWSDSATQLEDHRQLLSQLFSFVVKHKSRHRLLNGHTCVPIKLFFWTLRTEFHFPPQNIILLIFKNHVKIFFKNWVGTNTSKWAWLVPGLQFANSCYRGFFHWENK